MGIRLMGSLRRRRLMDVIKCRSREALCYGTLVDKKCWSVYR